MTTLLLVGEGSGDGEVAGGVDVEVLALPGTHPAMRANAIKATEGRPYLPR